MTGVDAKVSVDVEEQVDPRWIRSRTRLLDAAAELLSQGGIEAVTIDAVTKQSKVARTTLYRHFGCASDLLAATLERLIAPVNAPSSMGTLRDRLIDLVCRQATVFEEAPLHVTTLAWLALRSNPDTPEGAADYTTPSLVLQRRIIAQYIQPLAAILQSSDARDELGEIDVEFAACQLSGPLLFAWMTGVHVINRYDCVRVVDNFLAGQTGLASTPTRGA